MPKVVGSWKTPTLWKRERTPSGKLRRTQRGWGSEKVTIGQWTIRRETNKDIVKQYMVSTLESMAGYDNVCLPMNS